jgi:hypothetical protein
MFVSVDVLQPTRCALFTRFTITMSTPHPPHHITDYASPVLRAASPASSVGTLYEPDQTALSDTEPEMSQHAFELKWQERLGLGLPTKEEVQAMDSPLLPIPTNAAEEKGPFMVHRWIPVTVLMPANIALYERVMRSLRQHVHQIEENDIYDQILLRGSQVVLEPQPSTTDITGLMQRMMGGSVTARQAAIADGPWNHTGWNAHDTGDTSVSTAGRMILKSGGRPRKV